MNETDKVVAANVYYMLIMLTSRRAVALVLLAEPGDVLTAWEKQLGEYAPRTRGRQTATLSEIFVSRAPEAASDTFERMIQVYSQVSNERLSGAVRFDLVMAHLGDDRVRDNLQLNASRINTWKRGETKLEKFHTDPKHGMYLVQWI